MNDRYNSTHGSRSSSKTNTIRISKKQFIKGMVGCFAAGAIITGLGPSVVNKFQENIEAGAVLEQYQDDVLNDNIYRAQDVREKWYDYPAIVEELVKDPSTYDEKLFAVYWRIKDDATDEVLRRSDAYGDYENLQDYLKSNNYSDIDDWEKSVYNKIILRNKIEKAEEQQKKMSSELQAMTGEYESSDINSKTGLENTRGGK